MKHPGQAAARAIPDCTDAMLHEFFERAALRWPEQIAVDVPPGVERPERTLVTYAALEREANDLAQNLRRFIHGECVVGVLLPRTSEHLYAAQLAILKTGAAYTCLDPSFPDARIRDVISDARATVLLTDRAGRDRARTCELETLTVIEVGEALSSPADPVLDSNHAGPAAPATPHRLAYIIYTSGTTGRPKGVMIEHRSIANLVESDVAAFRLSPSDRVAQSSSAAYDSSVEEIWLAFAVGATLVVLDEDTVRLGPDLIDWLRRERVTVFCPPPTLLRSTGCSDPETALPELKLLYVGGEPLPRDVADRWSKGRALVNGYGPTECTVTCLRERVLAGEPITIGRPVRDVTAWVLNYNLELVAPGTSGELCIGGVGLARGYWQRPDLTAEKFILHPRLGRIYRTGDLVHCDASGQFHYHGRIDSQVKLRGYRIELGEIESRLVESPGVRAAACYVLGDDGNARLEAVVVPEDAARPPSTDDLKLALAKVLPVHMVPGRFGFLSALPTTVGGKLDRAALPRLTQIETPDDKEITLPRNAIEAGIHAAFTEILRFPRGISIHEDFFNDLGGDSLGAAQLVTMLRDDPVTAWATVRDIYEARTVAALAARTPEPITSPDAAASHSRDDLRATPAVFPWLTGLLQAAWIAKDVVLGSVGAYVAVFHLLPWAIARVGIILLVLIAPPLLVAGLALYTAIAVRAAVWMKKRLIGRYEPLRAPVWGGFYLRNWIVQRTVKLVPWWLIEETEFQNAALRGLGARIGERVHIHRGVDLLRGGWDLLSIGDDVTIGRDVALELVRLEAGHIVMGGVSLGNGCTLETHAHVSAGAWVESNGLLTARSSLSRGEGVPAGERWDGIPAAPAGPAPGAPRPLSTGIDNSATACGVQLVLARLILAAALLLPLELLAIGTAWLFGLTADDVASWMASPAINVRLLLGCVAAAVLSLPFLLIAESLACRAMGRVHPGVISRWSSGYVRVCLKAALVDSGSRWLYGTLFWPAWLRLAGMKVGARCEISSLIDTVPELVEIGDESFCADGIYLGGTRIHRGTVTLSPVRIGRNNFVGNGAIIPGGTRLPDNILLGVCTVADAVLLRPGTAWFGHPPFELARRAMVHVDRRLTHNPTIVRYLVRVSWELLRFALPVVFALIVPIWFALLARAEDALPLAALLLVAIPLLNLAAATTTGVLVIGIKWMLLGRVRPGTHPLWSSWASRWDFFCLAWNIYAAETVALLDGTPGLVWLLRATGVRVGKGVVFGNGFAEDLPDPDMLTFEDGATVDCLFQAHTFEDRVLKMDYVTVRRNATVGRNAVLLYGAEIGAATRVAPNSVVMKHEHLLPGRSYEGAPTHPQLGSAAQMEMGARG
jgi:non-ribosomal peptide synthetase-like protein